MKKIVTVLGARPQFIKAAVVSRNIQTIEGLTEVIVHTGQHFDTNMSDVFFQEMAIPKPQYNLNINGLGHGAMTGQMLERVEEVLRIESPDCVLVYGDTNSTLAGALAAKKLHIQVAHVEAGLRSYNMRMPEEINRILTDRISDFLFCPTDNSIRNLMKEGYADINCSLSFVGDVMYDASVYYASRARKPQIPLPGKFALCTIHRGENTDSPERMLEIVNALDDISKVHPVIFPLHPRTRGVLNRLNFNFDKSSIRFIEPVGYFEMIYLIMNSTLVITDSGGLQKEAYFFQKQCLVARDETEWGELVDHGYNVICGSSAEKIKSNFDRIVNNPKSGYDLNLYGNGDAGVRIAEQLNDKL